MLNARVQPLARLALQVISTSTKVVSILLHVLLELTPIVLYLIVQLAYLLVFRVILLRITALHAFLHLFIAAINVFHLVLLRCSIVQAFVPTVPSLVEIAHPQHYV